MDDAAPMPRTERPSQKHVAQHELVPVTARGPLRGPGPHAVSADGVDLVLVRTTRGPRLFQATCPHQGALLGEGEWDASDATLVCRNHRWKFDAETGRRVGGPECLVACPATERGEEVLVDRRALEPLRRAKGRGRHGDGKTSPPATGRRALDEVPGPAGVPVFGNLFRLDLGTLHLGLEAWAREYGPRYRLRLPRATALVVSDANLVQTVLRARPEVFRRASKLEKVFGELGAAGVFSAEGAAWRSQRKLAMEALAATHLRGFYPTLKKVALRLRQRWERAADSGAVVDVAEDLKRFTVDVTTALTFGVDLDTLGESSDAVIQRRLELLFPMFQRRLFAVLPLWRVLRLPADRAVDKAIGELRVWLGELVEAARTRQAKGASSHGPEATPAAENFLEAMVAARDDDGRPFADEVIFGNLMTMLLAGEDTTAYTLTWAIHHLCDAPAAVAALRAEADTVAGPDGLADELATAQGLAYANAVANETMRLRPVAPLIIFESIVDTHLADVDLPAGSTVIVLTRPANTEARNFVEPARFLPERWLDEAAHQPHEVSGHVPFGSGPRICPGRTLALLEMKLALSSLYGAFDLTRVDDSAEVRERFAFTMYPEGVKVKVARRKRG